MERPASTSSSGPEEPDDTILNVLKPALILVGMVAMLFLLAMWIG
ncbi:hypothetical protein [Halorussus halophilus]|nr:hypothetical protein [Halorussus halophilus]